MYYLNRVGYAVRGRVYIAAFPHPSVKLSVKCFFYAGHITANIVEWLGSCIVLTAKSFFHCGIADM